MRYLLLLVSCVAWGQAFSSGVGEFALWPGQTPATNTPQGTRTVCALSGSTLKCGQCGYVSTASGATKTLQNIHFMLGAVTKAGGTDLRVGIQSTSTTTGPPIQPDGTWLAGGTSYATIPDSSITASTWTRSGTVSGSLSMANGDLACIVVEPENYAGSDSFVISGVWTRLNWLGIGVSYNGSAWSNPANMSHLLEFTDGTFGYIGHAAPFNSVATIITFNSSSSPDEYALKFVPTTAMRVAGICAENPYATTTGNSDFVLYSGTTQLASASIDAQQFVSTSSTSNTQCAMFSSVQALSSGTTYYAAIKPTTTNNVRVLWNGAADASYWSTWGGGTTSSYSTRTDAGSWSDTTTRRPLIWLLVDGSGSTTSGGSGAYVVAQ